MEMTTNTQTFPPIATEDEEQRRWTRYSIDVSLRAGVRSGDLVKTVYGRGTNVSRGGLAGYLAIELTIGDTVELEITLPYSSQPLSITAVVKNRASYCYGLEFLDITRAVQDQIERCCRALQFTQ